MKWLKTYLREITAETYTFVGLLTAYFTTIMLVSAYWVGQCVLTCKCVLTSWGGGGMRDVVNICEPSSAHEKQYVA